MKLIMIGFLIGIGKIIPGVSGAVIAIRFGVYDKCISAITSFFTDIYNNTKYLGKLGIGIIISIIMFSNILLKLYSYNPLFMKGLFALLILTGIPDMYRQSSSKVAIILTCTITILLNMFNNFTLTPKLTISNIIILGIIESISVIIPGISGTAIMINLGVYELYLSIFVSVKLSVVLPFIFTLGIVSLILIYIVNYLIKNYSSMFNSIITGFMLASIIMMFI